MKLVPLTRIWLAAVMVVMMTMNKSYSQHLSSARGIGIGAFTSLVNDVSSLDWNPAGLVDIKDWELLAANFFPPAGSDRSFTFHTAAIGKRFMNDHAAAIRVTPGISIDFIVPSRFVFEDSSTSIITTFDQKINYNERYALGYAFRVSDRIALGLSARFLEEKVTDTKYSLDTNLIIRSTVLDYSGTSWALDWGMEWSLSSSWRIGLNAKNLFHITESALAEDVRRYSLNTPKVVRFGVSYSGKPIIVGIDGDTEGNLRVGGEWNIVTSFQARAGVFLNTKSAPVTEALAFGIGAAYDQLRIDISYLRFLSRTSRGGTADISEFQNSGVNNIEYNPFVGDRVSVTARVHFGRTRESLVRIEYVEMLSDVFAASQAVYAYRPIGKARVKNVTDKFIDAKVSFYVDRLMDAPTETKPYTIAPGDVLEIPFYAVFNNAVRAISALVVRDGEVYVNAIPSDDYDDRYQTRVLVHGRNDWNGDVTVLKFFVTPDDPDVLQFTRSTLHEQRTRLDSTASVRQSFENARIVFDEFARQLLYINDPKKSQDFVQYPSETLSLHGGDCDDMTVCYSSLLASLGTSVAFIDVVPPDRPEDSHIYMMFDSGIEARDAELVSDNQKRYVVRKNEKGIETVWIPVETTVISKGFEEAWVTGAQEYYKDVEINLGLAKGWVRLVDLETIF